MSTNFSNLVSVIDTMPPEFLSDAVQKNPLSSMEKNVLLDVCFDKGKILHAETLKAIYGFKCWPSHCLDHAIASQIEQNVNTVISQGVLLRSKHVELASVVGMSMLKIVQEAYEKEYGDIKDCSVNSALKANKKSVVYYLYAHGCSFDRNSLYSATQSGNLELVKFVVKKYKKGEDWRQLFCFIHEKTTLPILIYLHQELGMPLESYCIIASFTCNIDIFYYLFNNGCRLSEEDRNLPKRFKEEYKDMLTLYETLLIKSK